MPLENPLKTALGRGEKQLGLWLTLGSPLAAELAAGAGFDWVLIDMEHSVLNEAQVLDHVRAAHVGGRAEPIVRIPWNEPIVFKRLLDSGVRSFLVPYVQNAEEARRAVAATRYPPDGVRGFPGMHRGNAFGRNKNYPQEAAAEIFLAVQVESPQAADNAGAIAAVDGVDCVFVGPNDLAANMGFVGRTQPLVGDGAGAHGGRHFRVTAPRQQRQQRLTEPDVVDCAGQRHRRRTGMPCVERHQDHDLQRAPPALRGEPGDGRGAILQHLLEVGGEHRRVGAQDVQARQVPVEV